EIRLGEFIAIAKIRAARARHREILKPRGHARVEHGVATRARMQPCGLRDESLANASLADEQQWPAVLEPVERVDFLDLCFADGTAGSEVEVLEARSQGKARGFDAIAGFTCLAIVGFSLQQRIEQLCVTDLIARCLVHAPIE